MQHTQKSDTGLVNIGHNVRYSKIFFIYTGNAQDFEVRLGNFMSTE